jgi:aminomethyltransferase
MVTNSIQQLAPGQGCYNFVLNAQGRIQGDLTAFALEDSILLETDRTQIEKLLAHLNHFIIMDDVELTEVGPEARAGLLLAGPHAASLLAQLNLAAAPHTPLSLHSTAWHAAPVDLIHAHSPLVPRFELWSDPATIASLTEAIIAAGAIPISPAALEDLRILSGTPRYSTDIRETEKTRDLPQETAQTRALHFTKGCYLGQEIVERIHSRGNDHRTFAGFQLTGALPTPGTVLTADSDSDSDSHSKAKPVGELTSVAAIPLPTGPVQLALGYIRREALPVAALDRNLPLQYPGGTATPIALPYRIS